MSTIDYHGFTLDAALAHAEGLVFSSRINRRADDVEFITGRGVIRSELLTRLTSLGLKPSIKLGNDGVIVCTIE